ncbi:MAG TPA: hypothetical protein ENK18_00675 [Deltaproteobacteria bacterium]|nr:hypothetical protein [Deltaproteobacteria bacterium]
MWLMSAILLGCSGPPVVWDAVEDGDVFDNLATAMLLFGAVEPDGRSIEGPHLSGGTLKVNARPLKGLQPKAWPVISLAPDIVSVASVVSGSSGVIVDLEFHQQGTADLVLYDERGSILDVQTLRVRDPEGVELRSWDDLTIQLDEPLDEPVHVLPGAQVSLAISWKDALGNRLLGGGVLELGDDDVPGDVDAVGRFTGETDVIDLFVDDDAEPETFELRLEASDRSFVWGIELHDLDDVDELETILEEPRGGGQGTLAVRAMADGDRLVGAPITFTWGIGIPQTGTVLLWDDRVDGDRGPTLVEACYRDYCEVIEIPGVPTGVIGAVAPCGCSSSSGGLGAGGLALGLILLRRRRDRR